MIGSVTQQCNINTGCCSCRDTFRGEKCNECQIGYRDFPQVNDPFRHITVTVIKVCFYCYWHERQWRKSLIGFDHWRLRLCDSTWTRDRHWYSYWIVMCMDLMSLKLFNKGCVLRFISSNHPPVIFSNFHVSYPKSQSSLGPSACTPSTKILQNQMHMRNTARYWLKV